MSTRDPPNLRPWGWGGALRKPESYSETSFELATKTVRGNAIANDQRKGVSLFQTRSSATAEKQRVVQCVEDRRIADVA